MNFGFFLLFSDLDIWTLQRNIEDGKDIQMSS